MRHIKLLAASLIGLVGIVIYFITIPNSHDETTVDMTVFAGDEDLLDEMYFTAHDYNLSEIYVEDEEVLNLKELSYLERIDAPLSIQKYLIQQNYPELIDPLIYDYSINSYKILNAADYLATAHLEFHDENYDLNQENIYLTILNKDTREIEEDVIEREHAPEGDYVDLIGLHIEYPKVQLVYATNTFDEQTMQEASTVSVGEYNIETKNYSENRVLNEGGYFTSHRDYAEFLTNETKQLFIEYGSAEGGEDQYMYDYLENELIPLESENQHYVIGRDSQLYALEHSENETVLKHYEENGQEVLEEVPLENQIPLMNLGPTSSHTIEIIEDKLYVAEKYFGEDDQAVEGPVDFQVFDVETGVRLLNSEISLKTETTHTTDQAFIDTVGLISDFE